MTNGAVVVVGSVNEDIVLLVPRAPQPGETIAARSRTRRAGGKGANQAVAAARAGASVRMIGLVGEDAAGGRMLDDLRAAGVDVDAVAAIPGVETGAAYITVTAEGENTIVIDPGANARLSPEDVTAHGEVIASAAVMLAQLEVPVATIVAAVAAARTAGVRPVVTFAPAQDVPGELLVGLDPLLVNEHEAALLLGGGDVGDEPAAAAGRLLTLGPRSVVITLGAHGAVLADRDGDAVDHLPGHRVADVVDTTGAGDAFAGALAAALADGSSLADAVEAGMAAGARNVGRPGAR